MPKLFNILFNAPFWGRGFRPFFFFGAVLSVASMGVWRAYYSGAAIMPSGFFADPISWHAHEMIYGFSMAIVAGFLLTAVANWTGGAPARQIHLAALFALWAIGRVVMNIDFGLPRWIVIIAENLFIPALAVSLAVPLIRSWNRRNFIFLSLLIVLFVSDIWFLISGAMEALYVAMMMVLIMVSLVGGRIIPAFTVAALRWQGVQAFQTDQRKTDAAAIASLVAVALCLVFARETLVMAGVAALSCLLHAWRMRHYHTLKILDEPLVWILHAGYAWLVIGLGLLAATGYGLFDTRTVIHALTTGCIGSMILGMMCRVTLGHTGRELTIGWWVTISFYALQAATVMRVFGPMAMPEKTVDWIVYSAGLWVFCFMVYLVVYGRMLFRARPDGQEA